MHCSLQNRVLLAALLCVLLLTGCSSPAEKKQPASSSSASVEKQSERADGDNTTNIQKPEYGGRIILGSIGDITNLIPMLSSDAVSHQVASDIYVSPLKYDKDLNIIPYAAESFEVLDEGKKIRITMRKDVKWEDGTPLTAEDVEFTYKLYIDPNTPTAYAQDYLLVKKFTLIDKYTFEATYEKPLARILLSWMMDILPKHLLEGKDITKSPLAQKPVGAGPFKFKQWDRGQKIVLEASDTYFLGRPYLDEMVYRVIPDITTMFLELKAGHLDMMNLTPQQFLYQTDSTYFKNNFMKYRYLSFGYSFLGFNFRNKLFHDTRVRQAISYAIDKEGLVKGVLFGQGKATIGPYKPGTWVYNTEIEDYGYNPRKALELLNRSGWKKNKNGVLEKDGIVFKFTILTNQGNEERIKTATIIQSQLKDIGIQVTIRTVEWAAFIKEFLNKGRFDALILGWNILQDPDISTVWHSSRAVEGGLNFIKYINPELDKWLEMGRNTLDMDVRKEAYDHVQEILHMDQPYCFLFVPYALPIVHKRFKGIEPALSGITHNLDRWWVPKSQRRYEVAN
ncbi:peptide-binding protein [Halodesulfovibrio marinisediminis]|uniref:Peptide/nickel transport system substrate-binding protein n=1 Tax=Halodesulfovibrio marinisediminis DSM 17456 TaxID=1121457 RepID=A0A1N6DI60_9BACT|nr:peptide-binding protein [Halodesulfovibrio marinisediminis]SIN70491.1 peptide/nickel transport system substrate-binding protein [Halodesulfovibrio marinisediminis DSM 17456]